MKFQSVVNLILVRVMTVYKRPAFSDALHINIVGRTVHYVDQWLMKQFFERVYKGVIKPVIRMFTHVCPLAVVEEWLRCQSTQSPCTQDRVTCTYNDYIHHWPQTGPLRYILYHGNDTCLQDIQSTQKGEFQYCICYKFSMYIYGTVFDLINVT